jgi:hypothetical protein
MWLLTVIEPRSGREELIYYFVVGRKTFFQFLPLLACLVCLVQLRVEWKLITKSSKFALLDKLISLYIYVVCR